MEAGIASSAENLGLDGDSLPHLKICHTDAQFHDLSGYLMPLGQRIGDIGVASVKNMDIAAADADLFDLHQDLVRTGYRHRHLVKQDLLRLCHQLLLHHFLHSHSLPLL